MTPDREPLWLTWSELRPTLARTGARWKKTFPDWMRAHRRWALNYENLRAEVVPGSSPLEPDPLVLALYAELGRRRDSMDTLMWQVPASRWRCRPCYWRSRSLAMESGACTLQPR